MLVDHSLEFTAAGGQTLAAAAASANYVDLGETYRSDMSKQLYATFVVDTAITGTLQCKLQDCATYNGQYADLVAGVVLSAPAAGTIVQIPMPMSCKRFVKAYFGGSPTAGKVHAFLTTSRQQWHAVAEAPSVASAFVTEQSSD